MKVFDVAESNTCLECGSLLPKDLVAGLCPACLLKEHIATGFGVKKSTVDNYGRWIPPSLEDLTPIFPELELDSLLGRGGMGAVYKARQKNLERTIALKILPREIGGYKDFAARFTREARALASLNHPHIVSIYDFGEHDGLYFFIMEYVDGTNLRKLLLDRKTLPQTALEIIPQICDALQFAHDRGVIHRDIKPENILLSQHGRVKIADFGLARLRNNTGKNQSIATDQVIGTPQYMAPEQIEHPSKTDHRADIYSLGVVFYELLTGELPMGRFAPPSQIVTIDIRLDEIVMRSLEKAPELRYQQVSDLNTALKTIVGDAPSKSASAKIGQSVASLFKGKNTYPVAIGTIVLLSLLLGVTYYYWPRALQNQAVPITTPPLTTPPPTNIYAAWENAGAQSGWMIRLPAAVNGHGGWDDQAQPGDIPAFRFVEWTPGIVYKLPPPKQSFGLDLSKTHMTDAGLKELAGFTQLRRLYLDGTDVTDAGMKELAGFMQLQSLNLVDTHVTDSGLRQLASLTQLQMLNLNDTQIADAGLQILVGLKQLRFLGLRNTHVTDAGLKEIAGLMQLQMLNLSGTHVTDADLQELAGLTRLQWLDLGLTNVSDAGLRELAGLKNQLQTLFLGATQVTDAGLKQLADFTQLQNLELGSTNVTDAGLKELAGLTQLQTLDLDTTHVTDSGLEELAGLTQLQTLNLYNTNITDTGLKQLAGLAQLRMLDVSNTNVTDTGVTELQKALPNLKITY
jgi:serine/threonine protein kinase